jgi:polysaccharide export outer membrane protein
MNIRKLMVWVLVATASTVAFAVMSTNVAVAGPAQEARADARLDAPHTAQSSLDSDLHKRDSRYTIHPSDSMEITFSLTPEFNQTVTVQPDGYITLRDAGDISAAGKTLPELTAAIKSAYSKILHDPIVSIDLKDFEKPYFIVGGQVGKPGKFDWRVSDQWTEARIIDVKKMLNSGKLQEDPELHPGDMLFVPKNALSKIKPFLPTSSLGAYYNPAVF